MPSATVKKFTDNQIKGLRPEAERYSVTCNGLELRVAPTGHKSWYFRYRLGNKAGLRLSLGVYPGTGLYEANRAADNARRALERGIDPANMANLEKQAMLDAAQFTVSKLAEAFLAGHKVSERTAADYKGALDRYVLPTWKDTPVEDIKRADAKALLQSLTDRGIARQANLTAGLLRQMWRYGNAEELMEVASPWESMKMPAPITSRNRFLAENEISTFWHGLQKIRSRKTRAALRLILVLVRRETEIVGAKWDEFDLEKGEWYIPRMRDLNGEAVSSGLKVHLSQAHQIEGFMVPLSTLAVEILKDWQQHAGDWPHVFPCETDKTTHHSVNAIGAALRKNWKEMKLESAITPHDLRRTAATHMSRIGIASHIIDRVTGHAGQTKIQKIYNRYDYLEEKRGALETWAAELRRLIG